MFHIASSTGMHMVIITATGISVSQAKWMLPVLPWFVGTPVNLNVDIFCIKIFFYASNYHCWVAVKDTSVNAFPTSFIFTIIQLCCITTGYHTPTSYFLAGAILRTGTTTSRLVTCVPSEVHWLLFKIFFSFHCNHISQWYLILTSTF